MNTSSSTAQHKAFASERGPVAVAIVTVSDSRTPETDTNAHYLQAQIAQAGHRVAAYQLIKDEAAQVVTVLDELVQSEARLILFNGGTGISTRDTTYDALSRKLEKTLPGFGELFRMLSYEQVGAAAMLSRATAGVYRGKVVISTPGSPAAVQLAWEKLIAPELAHLAWEVAR
jgi:molybdenum cofactor biosynthesis protein B